MRQNLDECIAVIGLAGKFPGACNAEQFWLNLAEGHEAVRFPGDDELRAAGVPTRFLADPDYIKAVAEAPDLELFDAEFFGFTPRDAALLDPQIRMFLEVAHAAVENGGYDPIRIAPGTGVFGATGANRYLDLHVRAAGQYEPSSTGGLALSTLSYPDYVATHAAYRFGFGGPALTVSTACSSSAVAIHLASQALRTGECDFAIAGGTEAEIPAHHGYQWDPGGPMSQDGHCRPFDRQASGTIFSTGAGAVLLKRLGDAITDGDHIWAVIRASAVNNDGAAKAGFSAPGVPGQVAVIQQAMALAEVDATHVSYVEAHATGTLLGDPIEVTALARAFRAAGAEARTEPVVLSSVKGNVGHLGHAAGVTSLIKLSLCLEHQRMAGTVNFVEANPRLALAETPFEVRESATAWPREPGRPRIAGMSSLGIGGTNVHLVVEEGPAPVRTESGERPRVMLWSASGEQAAREYQAKLAMHLRWHGESAFADTAGTLQDGRTEFPVRAALVAASTAETLTALNSDRIEYIDRGGEPRPVAFLFPGQAAQQSGMAAGLYEVDRGFTTALDTCLDLFAEQGLKLRDHWPDGTEADIADTAIAQPLLFSIEYALAAMWRSWGVEPAIVLGHSLGELTAATVAGTFELSEAVGLVAARGAAMAAMPTGFMLAVAAEPDRVAGLSPDGVSVAVVNESAQTVLSGPEELLDATVAAMRAAKLTTRRLATSHAFHSAMMAPAAHRFAAAFESVRPREPRLPMISSATGAEVSAEVIDPAFWTGQLTSPVRFDRALDRLLRNDCLLLEVGPGRTLGGIAGRKAGSRLVVPTLPRVPGDDHRAALAAVAAVWAEGHRVDWPAVRQYEAVRRLPMPGYQYQRSRHWLELRPETEVTEPTEPTQPQTTSDPTTRSEAPQSESSPFGMLTWLEQTRLPARTEPADRLAAVLLPAEAPGREATIAALQQSGCQLVLLTPGAAFAEQDDDFQVRPDNPGDLDRVLDALATRGRSVTLLVHALGLADWPDPDLTTVDEQLTDSFHSLTVMAQRGLRADGVTGLLVLARRSVDITGAEPVDSVKATLHGAIRSLAAEVPELDCRLIDVSTPINEAVLATEIATPTGEPVIALRGPARWARVERPFETSSTGAPIRRGGVYLITGGLGGLGLAVARALAGTGQRPNLILLGRTGITDDRQRAAVATLEKLGATVRVETCDVGDRRAMRRVFDTARARHGAVHGVLHLAGVPGGGMLLLRRRADADAVLRPKVTGTLVLVDILAGLPPLDFFVSFSSRAAIGGLVGSADYAAANCFLDARTRLLARSGVPALTVNWPSWHTVGMAAVDVEPLPPGGRAWETVLDTAEYPVLDEHRIGAVPVLPGTGHLDLVVRAFRAELATPVAPVRLIEVVFHRVLTAQRARRVRVEFRPDGTDWRFVVRSRPAHGDGPWLTHVTGGIGAPVDARPAAADLAALRARLTEPAKHDPSSGGAQLFTLGPRWDNVTGISTDPAEPTERLVDLALPTPYLAELAAHPLHPTMLDSATAEARVSGVDEPHLPFCYGSLTLHENLPARFTSHIRRHADAADGLIVADIDMHGDDGRLLAAVTGFTMRRVADDGFLAEPESVQDSDTGANLSEGIAPEQGARLTLALLGDDTVRQVSVLPHVGGRPVGLVPVTAGPTVTPPVAQVALAPTPRPARVAAPPPPAPQPENAETVHGRLRQLWMDVLGVTAIDSADDFFDLGGNSLTAVELMSTMRDAFGVRMSIVAMFDHPTLSGLADAVAAALAEQENR